MFGNFDFYNYENDSKNSEIINTKLDDKENPPSLEDILLLEGIVDELHNKNKKLINFFTKEKIKQMLDYIIKEPKDDDHNKGHKFPFLCSKIFDIEEKNMMNYFHMTNKELIENKNMNQRNSEISIEENMNIDNNEDDIAKYYKINKGDNFEDDNFDEVNIVDEINTNNENNINNNIENGGHKEENKDFDDDQVNYKDDINDKKDDGENNENKEINIDDNLKDFNFNDDKKDDEDDLVNHFGDDLNNNDDINQKEIKNEIKNEDNNKNNKYEEDIIVNNKIEDNQDELVNFENDKDKTEQNSENKNEEINTDKVIDKKEDKLNNEKNNEEDKIEEKKDDYPEDRIEILDYFLSFLLSESELNYVLCGYFSSLMTVLLDNYHNIIIKYLFFKRKDILQKLVFHSYRKSIAETLYKIINYEENLKKFETNEELEETEKNKLLEIRTEIIKNIYDTININMDTEKLSSLSYLIHDLSRNKSILEFILNSKYIINSFLNKQLGELNLGNINKDMNLFDIKNNFVIICDIIIYWLDKIKELDIQTPMLLYEVDEDLDEDTVKQNQEKSSPIPELHHTVLSQALVDILPNLIKNNFNENKMPESAIQNNNEEKLAPFGLYRIKIVELITQVIEYFKNIPNEIDNILINCEFIPNVINYIFKYQNNNLYQESIIQFFKIIFKKEEGYPYHEIFFEYLFSTFNILEKIKSNFPKCGENEGNTGSGITSFLVSLSYKINSVIGGPTININKNYIKDGSMTFITRGKNPRLNGISFFSNITEKEENDNNNIKNNDNKIPCLEKYCNDEWKYFFSEKIESKVKLYEDKLCDIKDNDSNEKDDDLFYNNEVFDKLAGFGNKRYMNIVDERNKSELDDNKDMAQYKDMEVNINDFNFNENDNITEENDKGKEDNEFNYVNYWKNDLEKEKNSYVNILGEEAMKDLLEE